MNRLCVMACVLVMMACSESDTSNEQAPKDRSSTQKVDEITDIISLARNDYMNKKYDLARQKLA